MTEMRTLEKDVGEDVGEGHGGGGGQEGGDHACWTARSRWLALSFAASYSTNGHLQQHLTLK